MADAIRPPPPQDPGREVVGLVELSRALGRLLDPTSRKEDVVGVECDGVVRWEFVVLAKGSTPPPEATPLAVHEVSARTLEVLNEVDSSGRPVTLEEDGQAVAVLRPTAYVAPETQVHDPAPRPPPDAPARDSNSVGAREAVLTLVAVGSVVFAALDLPPLLIGLGVAIIVLVWRRMAGAPLRDPLQAGAAVAALALLVLLVVGRQTLPKASAPPPRKEASPGRVIVVDNRVTSGNEMREDKFPTSLTTRPVAHCGTRGCNITNTERETGGGYDAAVCQRRGERITNGDDSSRADDDNPRLFASTAYYGVRLKATDTFGYVSEVWIAPRYRGGLNLPAC